MEPLTQEFIDSCQKEQGRILRGNNMTRIETFVDAAFAFAFTMLVISIDEIPSSPLELFELSKYIPAFILSLNDLFGNDLKVNGNFSNLMGNEANIA